MPGNIFKTDTMRITALIACTFVIHQIWQYCFIALAHSTGSLATGETTPYFTDDSIWVLDVFRSELALSDTEIPTWQYNHPTLIYLLRVVYDIANEGEHNFFLLGSFNALIFSFSVYVFYKTVYALRLPKTLWITGLYALLPVFSFHTDASSESLRLLCLCTMIYGATRYILGNSLGLVFFFLGSILCLGMSKMYFLTALIITSTFLPSFCEELKLNVNREKLQSVIWLVVIGLVAFGISGLVYQDATNILIWLTSYLPDTISRTAEDRLVFHNSIQQLTSPMLAESMNAPASISPLTSIPNTASLAIFTLAGFVYPSLSQVIFFDKSTWVWFYMSLASASLIKLTLYGLALNHWRKFSCMWVTLPLIFYLLVASVWGPNFDTVRYVFAFSPFLTLALAYLLSQSSRRQFIRVTGIIVLLFIILLVLSGTKRAFVFDDVKIVLLVITPILMGIYVWTMEKLIKRN